MRLKIRAVHLRVATETILCGTDLAFNDGLVILRAGNSSGKSTVVQSIIYALGLEGMLSASHDVPLPHVMTDSIDVENTKLEVKESSVTIEIENAAGRVATVFRGIKGKRSTNLVSVAEGPASTSKDNNSVWVDYYVREGGAAVNQRGFHHWFATFIEWKLPKVGRIDGTECPLYVECVFPLMIIEQKRGWAAIQARMPFHYRIRDVVKKAVEFLLALDVYELALRRQKLREEGLALRSDWSRAANRVLDISRSISAVVQNLDTNAPEVWTAEEGPVILMSRGGKWLSFAEATRQDIDELAHLESEELPRVKQVADNAEKALTSAEVELGETDFAAADLLREVEHDQRQITNLDQRIAALEEDERRNRDVVKLQRLGSTQGVESAKGACPTCHQTLTDALLPQNSAEQPMSVEENLKFIRSQLDTFLSIREAATKSLNGRERRLESLRQRGTELRSNIRALRQTLVADGNQPSVEAIERRLRLRDKLAQARRAEEQIISEFDSLRKIGKRWSGNQEALTALPKGDLSERDRQKLQRLREIFVTQVQQFGFSSVEPTSLRISEENYKPEHDGFDLEFDISASDMIRTIWAYLHGLLELSRELPTNHLGLLILDEPKQQETARVSFGELFRRASKAGANNQQIIIATSEDESTLAPLLTDVPHQYINFSGRILSPLPSQETNSNEDYGGNVLAGPDTEETPWETKTRSIIENALASMEFDSGTREVKIVGFNEETLIANNREELERHLRTIATDAWTAYVPFESGEPVFECDEWGIVENAMEQYQTQSDEFFGDANEGNAEK